METDQRLLLQAGLFLSLLSAASVMDFRKRIIPDSICIGVALVGLILFSPIKLLGILSALPLLLAALYDRGVGGGDIKLTAAAGVVLGLERAMSGIVIGISVMLLYHTLQKIIRKPWNKEKRISYPLAPFLSLGFLLMYSLLIWR